MTGAATENYSVTLKVDDKDLEVKCIVQNTVGRTSATFQVEIQPPPNVQVLVNGEVKSNNQVDLGAGRKEDVTLRCQNVPSSATIEWFKLIHGMETSVSTGPDYHITVNHTNDKDTYKCQASVPGQPTVESANAVLFLAYPVDVTFTERLEEGGGKTIMLTAEGNPLHDG